MVTARFVGGKVVTDCPKCDLRASLHANGPTTLLCPHERLAVLLISAQRAKLVKSETVAGELNGEFSHVCFVRSSADLPCADRIPDEVLHRVRKTMSETHALHVYCPRTPSGLKVCSHLPASPSLMSWCHLRAPSTRLLRSCHHLLRMYLFAKRKVLCTYVWTTRSVW